MLIWRGLKLNKDTPRTGTETPTRPSRFLIIHSYTSKPMTDEQTTWDEIFLSLVEERNSGLYYNVGIVNYRNLTEHLDNLYTKIAELEARLGELK